MAVAQAGLLGAIQECPYTRSPPSFLLTSSRDDSPNHQRWEVDMVRALAAIVFFMLVAYPAFAQDSKPSVEVRAEYLLTIDAQLGSRSAVGQRAIVNVPGGTVRGPNIKGEILPPAGDWLVLMPDGSSRLD